MKSSIILFFILFSGWILFSGVFAHFYIIAGIFSSAATVYIVAKMNMGNKTDNEIYLQHRFYFYIIWLYKEIVISALNVSRNIWGLKKISPTVGSINTIQQNELGLMIYANSITATPGTICINAQQGEENKEGIVLVHALCEENLDNLRAGGMDIRIKEVAT